MSAINRGCADHDPAALRRDPRDHRRGPPLAGRGGHASAGALRGETDRSGFAAGNRPADSIGPRNGPGLGVRDAADVRGHAGRGAGDRARGGDGEREDAGAEGGQDADDPAEQFGQLLPGDARLQRGEGGARAGAEGGAGGR